MTAEVLERLKEISTDSIWWILNELGYPDTFMAGLQVLRPDLRMAGRAVTLRFLPTRRDLAEQVKQRDPVSINVHAAEEARPGDVMVADMGGELGGGFIGDVIVTRFQARGGTGIVADGASRDLPILKEMNIPMYVGGGHAAASWRRVMGVDLNIPVRCAGVTVLPGDAIVGDAQGVIAIPAPLAAEVADRAEELEGLEEYIKGRLLETDVPLAQIYPPSQEVIEEFRASRRAAGNR